MNASMTRLVTIRVIILVALVALGWFFLIAPRIGQPAVLASEAAELRQQASTLNQQASDSQAADALFNKATTVAAELDMKYPEAVETAGLTSAISSAAKIAGISPQSIPPVTPSEPVITGSAAATDDSTVPVAAGAVESATVTFDIQVTGNTDQLTAFMRALPVQERAIFVNTVAMSPSGERAGVYSAVISCTSLLIKSIPKPASSVEEAEQTVEEQANANAN